MECCDNLLHHGGIALINSIAQLCFRPLISTNYRLDCKELLPTSTLDCLNNIILINLSVAAVKVDQ
jgi:hypothetical protein